MELNNKLTGKQMDELKANRKAEESNLFICGVIDDGENCERVGDLDAEFFTVYRQNADGTSEALMDFFTREDAERALKLVTAATLQGGAA
ncbi:hypothetical protein RZO85_24695 [Raoultella ornithinolytica]|uniref:hypothetical protein n=1 Tax=Raoultella ornithinolytica TaxID=54291 RepID=UPI00292AE26D|nr:hypothetical protein [Raoultella ornithinolytica]MDV0602875.1 hypothetical protein [Raoultella ornithinolytica]